MTVGFIGNSARHMGAALLTAALWSGLFSVALAETVVLGRTQHYTISRQDTLYDIARQFDLGISELSLANPGIDRWQPEPGTHIILPTMFLVPPPPHQGVVINIAEMRLYFFPAEGEILTFPISSGQPCCKTPVGETRITRKRENPTWIPPDSIRAEHPELPDAIPPGPDNPLGKYALYLEWNRFVIHGTNRPWSIGQPASHGCIRMYPEDIATLYPRIDLNTPVRIIADPVSLAWYRNMLYMDVHSITLSTYYTQAMREKTLAVIRQRLRETAKGKGREDQLDWYIIEKELSQPRGIPIAISSPAK